MGKVYGKNTSGNTQLIIDGDAIDQRLSTLEANWDSISPIGSDNSWTVSNKLKEAWGAFGVGGINPGNNQVDIPLPFTAPASRALTIMTSLQAHEVEAVSYFTDVKTMGIALNASTIRLIAYNNGSHTVFAQIACHVIAREAY